MSKIQVDNIVNKEDTGAPTFPRGANIVGIVSATGGNFSGIVTATTFVGSASSLTGINSKAIAMSIVFGG